MFNIIYEAGAVFLYVICYFSKYLGKSLRFTQKKNK